MPKCQCCNQDCALINSKYCEECANEIVDIIDDSAPTMIEDAADYVKNEKSGE
jgi:hypothetical protein